MSTIIIAVITTFISVVIMEVKIKKVKKKMNYPF
jgi:hypothetical protein